MSFRPLNCQCMRFMGAFHVIKILPGTHFDANAHCNNTSAGIDSWSRQRCNVRGGVQALRS